MSDKALEPFQAVNYVDKLRDKIKQSLVDLIPTEEWDKMLASEVEGFFKDRNVKDNWGDTKVEKSAFKQVIDKVMREETERRMKELLQSGEWQQHWEGSSLVPNQAVQEIAKQAGTEMINAWLAQAVQQVVHHLRNNKILF